jgi:hypothetical protein
MKRILTAAALAGVFVAAMSGLVAATSNVERITWEPGGSVVEHIQRWYKVQDEGKQVVIDGMCISACTLLTGIVDDDRVCVTRRGQLVFHSATVYGQHHGEATRIIWNIYPERVREMLRRRGWDGEGRNGRGNEHIELIYISGPELRTLYKDCDNDRVARTD